MRGFRKQKIQHWTGAAPVPSPKSGLRRVRTLTHVALRVHHRTLGANPIVQTRARHGFGWKLASGALTLVLGIAILVIPVAGVASLALMVGAFLFAGGVTRTMLAFRLKPQSGWGWVLLDGLVSILVAILIAIGWPQSSLAFIGLLTGFSLIATGVWRILLRHHPLA